MEDQEPIIVRKTQLFLPRKLRRTMNHFWAFKEPKNPAIEVKVRKMKRNIIYRATICATALYKESRRIIEDKNKLGGLNSFVEISELIEAGICTPKKLRNVIYNRMIQEAADEQFIAAEEAAAAQQFIEETVEAAQRARHAAAAAVAAKEVTAAEKFAKEAAEAAELAMEAAENAKLAKRTVETYENAKLAREAAAAAKVAKKAAAEIAKKAVAAAQLADEEAAPDEKLGRLSLERSNGDE